MKTKLIVISICMLLISVSCVSVVNAQENKIKMKVADRIVKYCERQMIPRYEKAVFERMDRNEVEVFYDNIYADFMEISGNYSTTQIEIILWLVTLIAMFFATMTGYNPISGVLCYITVFVVCIIPLIISSILWAFVETTVLGVGGLLAFFDIETIELLIYDVGIIGAFFFFILLVPVLMIIYLLALPVVSLINMSIFAGMIIKEINDFFSNGV